MNRFGWLAAIIAVVMFCNVNDAEPKPTDDVPPKPADVVVEPKPTPAPSPTPKVDTALADKLEAILAKLDIASLQTLVDKLESVDVKKLKSMVDLLNRYGEPVVVAESPPPKPAAGATTICPCRGNDKNGCLCLKAGVKCHCTKDVGSIWEKTKMKANVNTGQPITEAAPKVAASPSSDGYAVTANGAWATWIDASGVNWNNSGTGLHEGQVYGGRFTYRNGSMHDSVSRAATSPPAAASRGGYFKRVCRGNYCEMVWVPN